MFQGIEVTNKLVSSQLRGGADLIGDFEYPFLSRPTIRLRVSFNNRYSNYQSDLLMNSDMVGTKKSPGCYNTCIEEFSQCHLPWVSNYFPFMFSGRFIGHVLGVRSLTFMKNFGHVKPLGEK